MIMRLNKGTKYLNLGSLQLFYYDYEVEQRDEVFSCSIDDYEVEQRDEFHKWTFKPW